MSTRRFVERQTDVTTQRCETQETSHETIKIKQEVQSLTNQLDKTELTQVDPDKSLVKTH